MKILITEQQLKVITETKWDTLDNIKDNSNNEAIVNVVKVYTPENFDEIYNDFKVKRYSSLFDPYHNKTPRDKNLIVINISNIQIGKKSTNNYSPVMKKREEQGRNYYSFESNILGTFFKVNGTWYYGKIYSKYKPLEKYFNQRHFDKSIDSFINVIAKLSNENDISDIKQKLSNILV